VLRMSSNDVGEHVNQYVKLTEVEWTVIAIVVVVLLCGKGGGGGVDPAEKFGERAAKQSTVGNRA